MSRKKDMEIIRELAKQLMEIAMSDRYVRMRQRFRDTNDLKIVRPPVIIEEIPWHEMNYNGELDCICEDPGLRGIEWGIRSNLMRHKYFKCDNYITPYWQIGKSYSSSGDGYETSEELRVTDQANGIVSHHYNDVFEDESALELYRTPVITPHPENDRANLAFYEELLDGIMPVMLCGHFFYHSPWDRISMLRGVEPILIDMYERPEYLHQIISMFTQGMASTMDQMEKYGLCGAQGNSLHCTPCAVTLPEGTDGEEGTCRTTWFRTMAQMFSTISPDAHYEFDMQYSIPLASRCAYTYYGCCEPLHDRIEQLKNYPNLRKIGVSPWSDIEMSAEAIEGNYVFSRKPNPANVAHKTDPEVIRKEITETVKACQKYGCPLDITLKDISTVGYRPENLMVWSEAVSDVLDEYYGEA